MRIVRATPQDVARVVDLFAEYFAAIELPRELRDGAATVRAYLVPPSAVWLAEDSGHDAGIIAMRPLPAIARACEVKRLYVRPVARRKGIADGLLNALEAHARGAGLHHLYLDTRADMLSALQFYRRRGYEPCEPYNDNPVAAHHLRRRLV